jgi:hypothetical protein
MRNTPDTTSTSQRLVDAASDLFLRDGCRRMKTFIAKKGVMLCEKC